jgi:hypothetical protein
LKLPVFGENTGKICHEAEEMFQFSFECLQILCKSSKQTIDISVKLGIIKLSASSLFRPRRFASPRAAGFFCWAMLIFCIAGMNFRTC